MFLRTDKIVDTQNWWNVHAFTKKKEKDRNED